MLLPVRVRVLLSRAYSLASMVCVWLVVCSFSVEELWSRENYVNRPVTSLPLIDSEVVSDTGVGLQPTGEPRGAVRDGTVGAKG